MNRNSSEEERVTRFALSFVEIAPIVVIALRARLHISHDEAADVLDETLVKLLAQIRESNEPLLVEQLDQKGLRAYLATAVANRYRDRLKHRSVIERSEQELLHTLAEVATPESEVSRREMVELLRGAVRKLNAPYRDLFEALLAEDLTLAEFARSRGIKLGSIYTRFNRGLSALRKIWDHETVGKRGQTRKDVTPERTG